MHFPALRRLVPCLLLVFPGVAALDAPAQQDAALWSAPHFSVPARDLYQAASSVAAPDGANVTLFDDDEKFSFDEAWQADARGALHLQGIDGQGRRGLGYLVGGLGPMA